MASSSSGSFLFSSRKLLYWPEQTSFELKYLFFGFFSFSDHFPSHVSKNYLGSQSTQYTINSLGISLALHLPVCTNVHNMLGDTVGSSGFLFQYCPFPWCPQYCLSVDSHICHQRNNSMFSKSPREHVSGSSALSLWVYHFGKLLEDGSSGQKALIPYTYLMDLWFIDSPKKVRKMLCRFLCIKERERLELIRSTTFFQILLDAES